MASENDNLEIVKYLVENGADVNIQNKFGEAALIWAVKHNNLDIIINDCSNEAKDAQELSKS